MFLFFFFKQKTAYEIVGLYITANNATVGFLLNNGTFYDVVDPLGANFTDATGISSAGDIIGFYKDGNGLSRGFILSGYTLSGGLINGGTFTPLDDPNS